PPSRNICSAPMPAARAGPRIAFRLVRSTKLRVWRSSASPPLITRAVWHGRQRLDGGDGVGRKQPHQCRNDAAELRVALREILRAVQLVEKEVGGASIARVREQAGVRAREALLLVRLQRRDVAHKRWRGRAPATLGLDGGEGLQDAGGDVAHP